jgi:hypothetical protein
MAAPPHVRDDAHFTNGVPYLYNSFEAFCDENLNGARFFPEIEAAITNVVPLRRPTASDYFDVPAAYTNTHFFSDGTIFSAGYRPRRGDTFQAPESVGGSTHLFYRSRIHVGEPRLARRLFRVSAPIPFSTDVEVHEELTLQSPDDLILRGYAAYLIPAAVTAGKGILDHFFRGRIEASIDPASGALRVVNVSDASTVNGPDDLLFHSGKWAVLYETAQGTLRKLAVVPLTGGLPANASTDLPLNLRDELDQLSHPHLPETDRVGGGRNVVVLYRGSIGAEEGIAAVRFSAREWTMVTARVTTQPTAEIAAVFGPEPDMNFTVITDASGTHAPTYYGLRPDFTAKPSCQGADATTCYRFAARDPIETVHTELTSSAEVTIQKAKGGSAWDGAVTFSLEAARSIEKHREPRPAEERRYATSRTCFEPIDGLGTAQFTYFTLLNRGEEARVRVMLDASATPTIELAAAASVKARYMTGSSAGKAYTLCLGAGDSPPCGEAGVYVVDFSVTYVELKREYDGLVAAFVGQSGGWMDALLRLLAGLVPAGMTTTIDPTLIGGQDPPLPVTLDIDFRTTFRAADLRQGLCNGMATLRWSAAIVAETVAP